MSDRNRAIGPFVAQPLASGRDLCRVSLQSLDQKAFARSQGGCPLALATVQVDEDASGDPIFVNKLSYFGVRVDDW
jgi:hypothetical protein